MFGDSFGKVGAELATKGFNRGLAAAVRSMKRTQERLRKQRQESNNDIERIALDFTIGTLQIEIDFNEKYIAENS